MAITEDAHGVPLQPGASPDDQETLRLVIGRAGRHRRGRDILPAGFPQDRDGFGAPVLL